MKHSETARDENLQEGFFEGHKIMLDFKLASQRQSQIQGKLLLWAGRYT